MRWRPSAFVFSCAAIAFGTQFTIRPPGCTPLFCLVCLLAASVTRAQITITEILADNRAAMTNGGDFPGYVELHNASDQAANLEGMSLSNDPLQPRLFVFPDGTTLNPWGYLIVWWTTGSRRNGES